MQRVPKVWDGLKNKCKGQIVIEAEHRQEKKKIHTVTSDIFVLCTVL